jgi:hypothetical protein
MKFIRSITSVLRKTILVGWAIAIVWIYLGNLVNFHQNHIWGKQLIPVECSSTRIKENDSQPFVKFDKYSKCFESGLHFDFATQSQQVFAFIQSEAKLLSYFPTDCPLQHTGILAYSFRGPPSA